MNLQFIPHVQFPVPWPLKGMECDTGARGVDNAATTSGKEVQEALVKLLGRERGRPGPE